LETGDTESLLEGLRRKLVQHFQTGLGTTKTDDVARVFSKVESAKKRLDAVLNAAIELARMVAFQRAGYTLGVPPLSGDTLQNGRKEIGDTFLTNVGGDVGVDGDDNVDERAGKVAFIASPFLVKWGDGRGSNLRQFAILRKAYAVLEGQK
jgi:hypothetical protein